MGAYLSEPMTSTDSEDGSGNRMRFGASTMQGWRASQEDAHTCVATFDDNSSFYGVYDGHGGAEVAIYVAKHFPELLKKTEAFLNGDIEKAFMEAYLRMDASIKEPEILKEIQRLAKIADGEESGEAAADCEEENVSELYEEATMPLDKLVAKYKNLSGEALDNDAAGSTEEKPCSSSKVCAGSSGTSGSPRLKMALGGGASSSPTKSESSSSSTSKLENISVGTNEAGMVSVSNGNAINSSQANGIKDEQETEVTTEALNTERPDSTSCEITAVDEISAKSPHCNGNGINVDSNEIKQDTSEAAIESSMPTEVEKPKEESPTKKKGKVHPIPMVMTNIEDKPPKRTTLRNTTLAGLMAFDHNDDSSDFDSSDSDAPAHADGDDSDDMDEDDSSEDDGDDSEEDSEDEDDSFLNGIQEPGFDSGTTAVVSFLRWENEKLHLWVANAGDSRCVVSRSGTAIDMSYDHKPESEEETLRIVKAGGKVTDDGRVNGGLNLSRALGDHTYKQNQTLPPEEQMISPMPTVKHLELNPNEDEFLVLACDGVWNSMSSQQVVDFVKERIATAPTLSKICEELFETCLSEDTCGDGTGCDNMTAIIVQLTKPSTKRAIEDSGSEESAKRMKLDIEH